MDTMQPNNTNPNSENETRKRQVGDYIRIPIFDLEDAIRVAKTISDIGRGRLDSDSIARSMGYSNSTVRHHINSAKHYKIVESKGDLVKLTELGVSIVHPTSDEEYINSKIKAFMSCDIFSKIYERYKGKDLPQADILANIFARDEGVSFKTKDRTVENFIQSGIIADLIKPENGVYHCVESIEQDKDVVKLTKDIPERELLETPVPQVIEPKGIEHSTAIQEKTTNPAHDLSKIKITAEPFFELYINPNEKAFDALLQLLPFYKDVYCKKNDDSLQRIVS